MKKNIILPVLIYAVPALAFALASASAAPEEKPAAIEKRIEVHTGSATTLGSPMPPPAPVTFLGLEVVPVDETLAAQLKLPPEHGLVVRFVVPDSPAAAAGVQQHDVLTRLDDQLLIAPRQLSALVRSRGEGDTIQLTYVRAGAETRATATLAKRVPPPRRVGDTLHWIGEEGRARPPRAAELHLPHRRRGTRRESRGAPHDRRRTGRGSACDDLPSEGAGRVSGR